MTRLLDIEDLTLQFDTDEGRVTAVEGFSVSIERGQILGLVGESGSGKSVTAKSLMRLNAGNAVYGDSTRITLHLDGGPVDIMSLRSNRELQVVRGGSISMIFQEPMASFAPALTIGDQMTEQLLIHTDMSKSEAERHSIEMLERVGIADSPKRFRQYAFELSGGMRQRAMIAMALSTRPKLLIADEPTTALDVTIQAQVIDLMKDLVTDFGMAIIFITHDLGVIAQTADEVAVMYLGRLIEHGPVREVIRNPAHPYTQGLLAALPKLSDLNAALTPVAGDIPSPLERPAGCVFQTRCPHLIGDICRITVPGFSLVGSQHAAACHLIDSERNAA